MKLEDDHILSPGLEDCFPGIRRWAAGVRRAERAERRRAHDMALVEVQLTGDHARAVMLLAGTTNPLTFLECLIEDEASKKLPQFKNWRSSP